MFSLIICLLLCLSLLATGQNVNLFFYVNICFSSSWIIWKNSKLGYLLKPEEIFALEIPPKLEYQYQYKNNKVYKYAKHENIKRLRSKCKKKMKNT